MSTGAPGGQLVTRDALYGSKLSLSNNNRDEDHSPSKKFTVDATDGGSNTTIQPNGLVRSSLASHVQAFRFHVTNTDAVAIEAAPNGRAAAAASDADIDMQVATCDGDTSGVKRDSPAVQIQQQNNVVLLLQTCVRCSRATDSPTCPSASASRSERLSLCSSRSSLWTAPTPTRAAPSIPLPSPPTPFLPPPPPPPARITSLRPTSSRTVRRRVRALSLCWRTKRFHLCSAHRMISAMLLCYPEAYVISFPIQIFLAFRNAILKVFYVTHTRIHRHVPINYL